MSFAMGYEEMRALLEKSLKPSRYQHSLGVAETAVFLARRFGVDEEQAKIAGLLHDCAREFRNEDLIAEAEKRLIMVGNIERQMPLLLHAYIGSRLVTEKYGVSDHAIEQAIWRHTVGGAKMTELDKIIWFADMIEPNRDYPGVERLRELAQTVSLDDMVLAGLTQSIAFVLQKGGLIHPNTVIARNEILLNR
ncbi:bis(5'-nucleosyl)-tetraphosphatase (symmetrical) YqeK [Selenomonas ruminantium]|uniref:bis(5'-nucleosyl)-tetraphosphatase (symmetrical) YqeK n=1 Tax=Selenomonas ruminantium TaxID=971 RepID=UPI000424F0E1|nr:bis(5'-nucleosyl)-tetraphosphatase (symmetrical) YqeK [Selenomonas ruminantium]